jgi:light-independent protochlorophyllide reductase subunit B
MGITINVVAPLTATPDDLKRLPDADFNICLYPEIAELTCRWLEKQFGQPWVSTVPIGVGATRRFVAEVAALAGLPVPQEPDASRLPWYSRSVDSTYLTGKRVFIFADATHAVAAARIAAQELGFEVVGIGTYVREQARAVRACAEELGIEALITDDYLTVEDRVRELMPELVLGTQMERHIAKRLGIPCAVISAPFHVQDCPARYSPQMGWEGANVIFDTWVHPLMMGLEEHLLKMFSEDFEFNGQLASHLQGETAPAAGVQEASAGPEPELAPADQADQADQEAGSCRWTDEAESELRKVPFFVRGKARNNTETYAQQLGIVQITTETLYDAKAHFAR